MVFDQTIGPRYQLRPNWVRGRGRGERGRGGGERGWVDYGRDGFYVVVGCNLERRHKYIS